MTTFIRTCILFSIFVLFGATSAKATPVELKFSGFSGMGYDYHFSGSIMYDTDAFVNDSYDVDLATYGGFPPFYAGHSSFVQTPSMSFFRIESSDWDGFDIVSFNTASNFVNSIQISTEYGAGPPCSSITFKSVSDQFSLIVENIHLEVHALAYAADRHIYDIPTAATPFWPSDVDYSEYYYSFRNGDFEDGGYVDGLSAIPEPATFVLLGAGVVAAALLRKRLGA